MLFCLRQVWPLGFSACGRPVRRPAPAITLAMTRPPSLGRPLPPTTLVSMIRRLPLKALAEARVGRVDLAGVMMAPAECRREWAAAPVVLVAAE
jgi:hypothetical protein